MSPEASLVIRPSPAPPDFTPIETSRPQQLITNQGEMMDIPPLQQVSTDTNPVVIQAMVHAVAGSGQRKAEQLETVAAEIEALDSSNREFQQRFAADLDIQKDALISEMRERITELEQIILRQSKVALRQSERIVKGTFATLPRRTYEFSRPSSTHLDSGDFHDKDSSTQFPRPTLSQSEQKRENGGRKVSFSTSSSAFRRHSGQSKPIPFDPIFRRPPSPIALDSHPISTTVPNTRHDQSTQRLPSIQSLDSDKLKNPITLKSEDEQETSANKAANCIMKDISIVSIIPQLKTTLSEVQKGRLDKVHELSLQFAKLTDLTDNPTVLTISSASQIPSFGTQHAILHNSEVSSESDLPFEIQVESGPSSSSGAWDRESLIEAIKRAESEKSELLKVIEALKRQINDLPVIGSQFLQLRDELKDPSLSPNQTLVTSFLQRAVTDHHIIQIDAKDNVEAALSHVPQWEQVFMECDVICEKILKDASKNREKQLIEELSEKNKHLQLELDAEDRSFANISEAAQANYLANAIDSANSKLCMMERQLSNLDANSEVQASQAAERHMYTQFGVEQKKNGQLEIEIAELKEKQLQLQQKFQCVFEQATDANTSNQALQSRTNELLLRAQLDATKIRSLEELHEDSKTEMEELAHKLAFIFEQKSQLESTVDELTNEIENLRQNSLEVQSQSFTDTSLSKLIKLYQERIRIYQQYLSVKTKDILELRCKRACDQKDIILLRREISRLKMDERLHNARYNSVKGEVCILQKSVFSRDEIIRSLKREIERLRHAIRTNAPIQATLRELRRLQTAAKAGIERTLHQVKHTELLKSKFSGNPAVESYFDRMLERTKATLARLQIKRVEFKFREQERELANFRSVSRIADCEDWSKRVEFALNSGRLGSALRRTPEEDLRVDEGYKVASYADTLRIIGGLAGKRSPGTLRRMLRNSRRTDIIIPVNNRRRMDGFEGIIGKRMIK
jgi:hypothetical protein